MTTDRTISIPKKGFADFSPYFLLDKVLNLLTVDSSGGRTLRGYTDIHVLYHLLEEDEIFLYDDEFRSIIQKIIKDKYVVENAFGNGIEYCLTFEGLVFFLDGGYTQKHNDKTAKRLQDENERAILTRYTKLSVIWTMVASVVGALFLLFEIFKFLYIKQ